MRLAMTTLAAVLAVTPIPARAQEDDARERREQFQLFTNCARVVADVYLRFAEDSEVEGLTEERLRRAIDSRLRAARLFESRDSALHRSGTGWTVLEAWVTVVGRAFHVEVQHRKVLSDPLTSQAGIATTWKRSTTGTHGDDGEYVVGPVSRHLDEFLDEYLRVNESACAETTNATGFLEPCSERLQPGDAHLVVNSSATGELPEAGL